MSSPIPIPYSSPPRDASASSGSPGLYIPVHKRASGSRTPSPSPSSASSLAPSPTRGHYPLPALTHAPGIYTPAELLRLSASPLSRLAAEEVDRLRAIAPEVVQTRKQRKARAWHNARRPTHARGSPTSESEEERTTSWRRV